MLRRHESYTARFLPRDGYDWKRRDKLLTRVQPHGLLRLMLFDGRRAQNHCHAILTAYKGFRGMRPHFQPLATTVKFVTPSHSQRVYTSIATGA